MGSTKSHRSQTKEAMQHNRRMARTLGCLVASMTVGAALLDWVQPKRLSATAAQTELMSVVPQGTTPAHWRGIQVDPQSTANDRTPAHFLISPEGKAISTALWENQQPVGTEGVVRIGLLASDNSNQVTAEQWAKAQELMRVLQNACAIDNEQIHYDMLALPSTPKAAPARHGSTPPARTRRDR
jgi:hypothetical protein